MVSVEEHWHGVTVVTSLLVGFAGAYFSVCLAEQYRIAGVLKSKFFSDNQYLVLMSLAIGGATMWCMHFIGMGALTLTYIEDGVRHEVDKRYDVGLTVISLLVCIVCVFLGLYISSRDKMFVRDKQEIYDLILEEAKHDSMQAVRGKYYVQRVALFRDLKPLVVGGFVAGGGVCAMHYLGMVSIVADVDYHFRPGIVLASVLIAAATCSLSFWVLFRLLALHPKLESLRFLSALVITIAKGGMHYTGMAAVYYTVNHDPAPHTFKSTTHQHHMQALALIIALVFNLVLSALIQIDLRGWHLYLHPQVKETRKIISELKDRYANDPSLLKYQEKVLSICSTHEIDKSTNCSSAPFFPFTNSPENQNAPD